MPAYQWVGLKDYWADLRVLVGLSERASGSFRGFQEGRSDIIKMVVTVVP